MSNTKLSLREMLALKQKIISEQQIALNNLPVEQPKEVQKAVVSPYATLATRLASTPQPIAPSVSPIVEDIKEVVTTATKTLSLQEILAMKRATQLEAAMQYVEQETEERSFNTTVTKVEDDVVPNIKEAIAEALIPIVQEQVKKLSLQEILALRKAGQAVPAISTIPRIEPKAVDHTVTVHDGKVEATVYKQESFSLTDVLNDKQQSAVDFTKKKVSYVVLGAAGTGKTTSERAMSHAILEELNGRTSSFKVSGDNRIDAPAMAICAYTRRAASNSAKAILKDPALREQLNYNIMTIHALLEFIPEEYYDEVDEKTKFRFAPTKTAENPLTLKYLIIEEATLLGLDLWAQLLDALPSDVIIIFVGDINQLPPVFGPSILNYAITRIPVIELTQVYRQAEGSPIINNAHRILKGEMLVEGTNDMGKLVINSGKKDISIGQDRTSRSLGLMFEQLYDLGMYSPDEDMILSPWNKQELGTDRLNTRIAEFLSVKYNTVVYEVLAGFTTHYLAVNDKIMFNKRDCIIADIETNRAYVGKQPKAPSTTLSRFGITRMGQGEVASAMDEMDDSGTDFDYTNFSIEEALDEKAERKQQSSHRVTLSFDDGTTQTLSAVGDFSPQVFSLGYAMTVHKSQGSEWRRVFIVFHKDHATSLSREMLYTAITRAREEVYLLAKRATLDKAVTSQRVKGNTLQDKIEYFNSGIAQNNEVTIPKGAGLL